MADLGERENEFLSLPQIARMGFEVSAHLKFGPGCCTICYQFVRIRKIVHLATMVDKENSVMLSALFKDAIHLLVVTFLH